jgi:hypothetical protein
LRTVAGTRRGLRDSPLGRAALLAVVLLAAFLVARSCGSSAPGVSQERAVEIARGAIDFEAASVQVRNLPTGVQGKRSWAVSLYNGTIERPTRCRLVQLDADSGRIEAVKEC